MEGRPQLKLQATPKTWIDHERLLQQALSRLASRLFSCAVTTHNMLVASVID